MKQWEDFKEGIWKKEVNVSDFIQKNYESYDLDESFLKGKTSRTDKVWKTCEELLKEEVDIYEWPDCDIVRKKCENDCIGGGAFLNTTK